LAAGVVYHVLNRGNARAPVFLDPDDYQAFLDLLDLSWNRLPIPLLGFTLMPNHFHLVLWPRGDGDLGRWMQWILTSHVRRHHRRHGGSGHVWQGRFKAFPAQSDSHLLTVLRYVERNPLRANLVARAEDWQWSSLPWLTRPDRPAWLSDGPVPRPAGWLDWVNHPQTEKELEAVRKSVIRGAPFGEENWAKQTAIRLGLESALNPRGRPRREEDKQDVHFFHHG
jgi:putative transposase